jgi:hypothetical protein
MTLNVYAHLWPDEEDRTRGALDELLADPGHTPRLEPQTRPRKRSEVHRQASPAQEAFGFDFGR